jgi:hypothetical protein
MIAIAPVIPWRLSTALSDEEVSFDIRYVPRLSKTRPPQKKIR